MPLNPLRLIGVSMVRDESDIIESFVRGNLALLDRLVIYDDGSGDRTPAIVESLAAEGLAIELTRGAAEPWFDHAGHINRLIRDVADRYDPDFIFPLDGDEVIHVADRSTLEAALAAAPPDQPIRMRWLSYMPTAADDPATIDPLRRLTHRYAEEEADTHKFKVVVPRALARDRSVRVQGGQHVLTRGVGAGAPALPAYDIPALRLAHFPIRSHSQALAKVLCYELNRQTFMPRSEGPTITHYRMLEPGFRLTDAMLVDFARMYARPTSKELIRDPYPVLYGSLRYAEMIDVNVTARLVGLVRRVARAVHDRPRREELSAVLAENAALRAMVGEITSSTVWRLSAPLRKLGGLVRRFGSQRPVRTDGGSSRTGDAR